MSGYDIRKINQVVRSTYYFHVVTCIIPRAGVFWLEGQLLHYTRKSRVQSWGLSRCPDAKAVLQFKVCPMIQQVCRKSKVDGFSPFSNFSSLVVYLFSVQYGIKITPFVHITFSFVIDRLLRFQSLIKTLVISYHLRVR